MTAPHRLGVTPIEPPPVPGGAAPALVGRKACAAYCGVSVASWDRLTASGKTPAPIRLAGRVVWRRSDLDAWIAAGCPSRDDRGAR